MVKIISSVLFFLILGYIFFQFNSSVFALTVSNKVTNIINETVNKLPITFNDANHQNPTTKFNGGSNLYLKFNTSADGTELQEAWLLNSNKEKIQIIPLTRTGNNPYIYVGDTIVPSKSGIYYLSLKISGHGSSFAFEQNIDISDSNNTADNKKVIFGSEKQNTSSSSTIIPPPVKQEKSVRSILFDILTNIILLIKSFTKKGA